MEGLESLWALPTQGLPVKKRSVKAEFDLTRSLLGQLLKGSVSEEPLAEVVGRLKGFVGSWAPTGTAHNDFYDDQLLVTKGGALALVDFEEIGLGDPQLDIANTLSHLRWMAGFGTAPQRSMAYHAELSAAALDGFQWHADDLAMREAFCLFRLCGGPLLQLKPDWMDQIGRGLTLVGESLSDG